MPPQIPRPLQCVLWSGPEPLQKIQDILASIETYLDESHDRRCLLKCRECGQLYFYQFLEFVDYEDGEDSQYRTYIPVSSPEDAATLSLLPEWKLIEYFPAIHDNWPKGQDKPAIRWVGRRSPE